MGKENLFNSLKETTKKITDRFSKSKPTNLDQSQGLNQ
jgi:hypothetical protein